MASELTSTGNPITSNKIKENVTLTNGTTPPLTPSGCHGNPNGVLPPEEEDGSGAPSPSEDESSSGGEEATSSSSEEEILSEATILSNAGVDSAVMASLAAHPPSEGVAPLGLLSEFVSCCMRDEYKAALILCRKVLDYEPSNETAKEFLPVIQERLQLDVELPTESSSSDSDDNEEDQRNSATAAENQNNLDTSSTSQHHQNCSK